MKPQNGSLLDTNVLSELRKPRPNRHVLLFFESLVPTETYVSTLTLGELRKGAAMQRQGAVGATELQDWIDGLEASYADRILPINLRIAHLWGELSVTRSRPIVDTLIAATAIHHKLVLVTRNIRDVQDTPVVLHNPWLD